MTHAEIIQAIRREHINFLTAIGGIPDDVMIDEPVAEELTIKDMMAHIAMWMRVAIKFVQDYKTTGVPKSLGLDEEAKIDAFNEQGWEARRELPLAQVIGEFAAAYGDLIAAVESLSDEELNAPLPPPWGESDTLERLIAVNSYEHEPEHTTQLLAWREENEEHEDD